LSASADNSTLEKVIIGDTYYDSKYEWDTSHTLYANNGKNLSLYVKNRGTNNLSVTVYKSGKVEKTYTIQPGKYENPQYTDVASSSGTVWRFVVTGSGGAGVKMDIAARQY
jgi:archaellum component FlaG (FlaF/FlaG flagellin family)